MNRFLALLPLTLVGAALFARSLANEAWLAFTEYRTPFAFTNAKATATLPLSDQVVVALVDGLGYEPSRSMPFLNELRKRGADFECRIGLPSLSLPGRAVIFTGAWQEIHGQTTNFDPRALLVEHLFLTAKRRGLRTALVGGAGTGKLFAPSLDEKSLVPDRETESLRDFKADEAELRDSGSRIRSVLRNKDPNLFLAEYDITDQAGHEWGGASSEYREGVRSVDEEIRELVGTIDLTRAVLVVTSDHGHTASGGHGGGEDSVMRVPLVFVGRSIRPHTRGSATQVDVAPTVAALLGIDIPASSQGRTLLAALETGPEVRQELRLALCQQRQNFVLNYLARVSGQSAPPATTCQGGEDSLKADLDALDGVAGRAKEEREGRDMVLRRDNGLIALGLMGLFWLVIASAGIAAPWEVFFAFFMALGGLALYFAFFPLLGLSYSLSAVNKDEALGRFFAKDMALAGCIWAGLVGLVAWWSRRRPRTLIELTRVSWLIAAASCSLFALKIAAVYWGCGVFVRWSLPDPYWGFGFYLDALALMAIAFSSLGAPILAFLVTCGNP
jgi:hypothetical protein